MAQAIVILALPLPFVKLNPNKPRLRPYLGLGLGILAVSTASLFIRFAQQESVPALVIAAYRLTLATLILAPAALWRQRAELRPLTHRDGALALASGVFLSAHFGTWITSLAYTTIASSVVLYATAPLWAALMATIFLREKITRVVVMGMGLAVMGSVVVGLSDACAPAGCPSLSDFLRGRAFFGDLLALAGAVTIAIYFSLGRKLRATMSLVTYTALAYGTAASGMLVVVVLARLPLGGYAPRAYLWLGLLALIPQLIGHSAFNWALKFLPTTYVAVMTFGEPIGATMLAAVFLREAPSLPKLIGGALILAGIALASR